MDKKIYTTKELQRFNALLTQYESKGVMDARFIRQQNQNEIDSRFLHKRVQMSAEAKERARKSKIKVEKGTPKCPDCGSTEWYLAAQEDGVSYYMCRECRFSKGGV